MMIEALSSGESDDDDDDGGDGDEEDDDLSFEMYIHIKCKTAQLMQS